MTEIWNDGSVQLLHGSSADRATFDAVPDRSVRTIVTSPPYWGLRDYGADGQTGLHSIDQTAPKE